MKELKDSERNLINEGLVVVDYSAEWCGGCQVIKPIVEKLATEYEGKVNRLVGSHPEKTIRENLDLLISESGNE